MQKILLFKVSLLFLLFILHSNSAICSFEGSKTSEDLMRLTYFSVSGENPVILKDDVSVSFNIKNVDKKEKQLGKDGLHIFAYSPSNKKVMMAKDFSGVVMKSLDVLSFNKNVKFDEIGKWVIWPSYDIVENGEDKYAPNYWEPCTIYVEKECKKGSTCITEAEASDLFKNPIKASEEICGYLYSDKEKVNKYCFAEFSDKDNDTIADVVDQCENEKEVFNNFRDDDGCPDVIPQKCPEGSYCMAYVLEGDYILYKDENGSAIVCGYAGVKQPKFCYIPKLDLPDLIVDNIEYNTQNSSLIVWLKNIGNSNVDESFTTSYEIKEGTTYSNTFYVDGLERGEDYEIAIPYECQDNFTVKIKADSSLVIEESNENNNELEKSFSCEKLPDYTISSFSLERVGENLYKIHYIIENNGFESFEDSVMNLLINLKNFSTSIIEPLGRFSSSEKTIEKLWRASCPSNAFKFIVDSENSIKESNENNNIVVFPVNVNLTCPSSCYCVEGEIEHLEDIGYEPCFECNGEAFVCKVISSPLLTTAHIDRVFHCMATKLFNEFPCPPSKEHFGFYKEHVLNIEFSKWDDMEVGNVVGDPLDEILIAIDNDKLHVYDGDGNQLYSFQIRYTKYDRLTLADLDGDGYKEIITAVDDDAPGRKGRFYIYKIIGNSLNLIKTFDENFDHYDEVLGADLLGIGKDQLIITDIRDGKIYIYVMENDSAGNVEIHLNSTYSLPIKGYEFRYTHKAKDHVDDGIEIGNFLAYPGKEIMLIKNENSMDKSRVKFFGFDNKTKGFKLLRSFSFPFTKYDATASGDVLGDGKDEFMVAIDEHRALYIGDAIHGLIKVHFRKYTKYDDLEVGNIDKVGKKQVLIAIDEDDKIYWTFEDDLMEG